MKGGKDSVKIIATNGFRAFPLILIYVAIKGDKNRRLEWRTNNPLTFTWVTTLLRDCAKAASDVVQLLWLAAIINMRRDELFGRWYWCLTIIMQRSSIVTMPRRLLGRSAPHHRSQDSRKGRGQKIKIHFQGG